MTYNEAQEILLKYFDLVQSDNTNNPDEIQLIADGHDFWYSFKDKSVYSWSMERQYKSSKSFENWIKKNTFN